MKKSNIIKKTKTTYKGQEVTINRIAEKEKKVLKNARTTTHSCPNCLSNLRYNEFSILECVGDRLKIWEVEFKKYIKLSDPEKVKYLKAISNIGVFEELYQRWFYAQNSDNGEVFDCGYTNKIFLPVGSAKSYLPDPVVTKIIEAKLGRRLTEAEVFGETELWLYRGMVLTQWKKGAKQLHVPIISLPSEEEVYV